MRARVRFRTTAEPFRHFRSQEQVMYHRTITPLAAALALAGLTPTAGGAQSAPPAPDDRPHRRGRRPARAPGAQAGLPRAPDQHVAPGGRRRRLPQRRRGDHRGNPRARSRWDLHRHLRPPHRAALLRRARQPPGHQGGLRARADRTGRRQCDRRGAGRRVEPERAGGAAGVDARHPLTRRRCAAPAPRHSRRR